MDKPTIVCLCGSTKFSEAFIKANALETLAGNIVLSVGFFWHQLDALHLDLKQFVEMSPQTKSMLDALHFCKIDLADEILVLNVDGYIGESTANEIVYAYTNGKCIRFLEPGNYKLNNPDHRVSKLLPNIV